MCGICGELTFGESGPANPVAVRTMAETLFHRGPDSGGLYTSPAGVAALGFRRLSIIDLRADANQPLGNEDHSIQVVFNGEIYNFAELRQQLIARGHQFRSNADTEVIVHLYEDLGDRAIDELDGMFALALWDDRAQRLLLARDRAGKKPLFYWQDQSRIVFGSEIKALLSHPAVITDAEPDVIPSYLLYGYVPHPETPYRGIRHVEPATVMSFERSGRVSARKYWTLPFLMSSQGEIDAPYAEQVERVRELVTRAVERRLVSDVPLGAFLSGGIDSTIVVGLMSRLLEAPVQTFTIGFDDNPVFDESGVARDTAARFKTRHTEFRVKASAADLLDTLVWHHDGPFADSSALPTYLVSRLTREHVTVALNGDGGDEVFAGYVRFGAALAAERVPASLAQAGGAMLALLPKPAHERDVRARARRFFESSGRPMEERVTAWAGVLYDSVEQILQPELRAKVERRRNLRGIADGLPTISPLSRLLAVNFHSYLHDDLLVKADRMTMANSLEARSPLLDRALIEYVARLPDDSKLQGRRTKAVLRDAFADLLPPAVAARPKTGFGIPVDDWFRGELRDRAHDELLGSSARTRAYLSTPFVEQLLASHSRGSANHGHALWALLTLERWLKLLPEWRSGRMPGHPRVDHVVS